MFIFCLFLEEKENWTDENPVADADHSLPVARKRKCVMEKSLEDQQDTAHDGGEAVVSWDSEQIQQIKCELQAPLLQHQANGGNTATSNPITSGVSKLAIEQLIEVPVP
jgi:hypothetical protein